MKPFNYIVNVIQFLTTNINI